MQSNQWFQIEYGLIAHNWSCFLGKSNKIISLHTSLQCFNTQVQLIAQKSVSFSIFLQVSTCYWRHFIYNPLGKCLTPFSSQTNANPCFWASVLWYSEVFCLSEHSLINKKEQEVGINVTEGSDFEWRIVNVLLREQIFNYFTKKVYTKRLLT